MRGEEKLIIVLEITVVVAERRRGNEGTEVGKQY